MANNHPSFINSLKKNSKALVVTSLVTFPILLLCYSFLSGKIQQAGETHLKQTIANLGADFPASSYDNDLTQDCYLPNPHTYENSDAKLEQLIIATSSVSKSSEQINAEGSEQSAQQAKEVQQPQLADHRNVVGYILIGSTNKGYNGYMQTLLVTDGFGRIRALRILQQTETPGLGTKIVTTPWVEQFKGKTLADSQEKEFAVRKYGGNIDQFTGATITPNAITREVRQLMNSAVQDLVAHPQQTLTENFKNCKLVKASKQG